jgi:hypothetical protein
MDEARIPPPALITITKAYVNDDVNQSIEKREDPGQMSLHMANESKTSSIIEFIYKDDDAAKTYASSP